MRGEASLAVLVAAALSGEVEAQQYDGTWVMENPVSYECCMNLIAVDFAALEIMVSDSSITVATSGSHPGLLVGAFSSASEFSAQATIPGACAETHAIDALFQPGNTLEGTFQMTFVGSDCSCFGGQFGTPCVNQTFPITAVPEAGSTVNATATVLSLMCLRVIRGLVAGRTCRPTSECS